MPSLPVRRQTTNRTAQHVRRQMRNANPAQQQKTVVRDHQPDASGTRPGVPAQTPVPRTQTQRRRHEAHDPERARRRLHQIRQTAAGSTAPPQRMRRLQKTRTQTTHRRRVRRAEPNLPQRRQAAGKLRQSRTRRARPTTGAARRTGTSRRQTQTQRRRQTRKRLPGRRRAQRATRVAPTVLLAETAAQSRPRQLPATKLPTKPLHRRRLQHPQPDSHRTGSTRNTRPVSTVTGC